MSGLLLIAAMLIFLETPDRGESLPKECDTAPRSYFWLYGNPTTFQEFQCEVDKKDDIKDGWFPHESHLVWRCSVCGFARVKVINSFHMRRESGEPVALTFSTGMAYISQWDLTGDRECRDEQADKEREIAIREHSDFHYKSGDAKRRTIRP